MCVVSLLHNFALIEVPKTGSKSQRLLYSDYGFEVGHDNSSNKIHPTDKPWHITSTELKGMFLKNGWDWDNCFKFGFVRNPWDREVSSFFYSTFAKKHKQTFSEYVKNAPTHPLMHTYLTDVDYVARFERYEDETNFIWRKIGLTGTPKLKHEYKTNHKPYWKYYNDVDIMVVHEAYKRDIAMYNYEFGEENDHI